VNAVCDHRAPLVDPATLAAELGVSRDFVYAHAGELGALRLGNGPKARLRFDPVAARAALARYSSEKSQPQNARAGAESERQPTRRRRRLPNGSPELLPDRPRRKAANAAE